jgi:hypothetical protein
MEFGKDLLASLHGRLAPPLSAGTDGTVAWTDLHARLSAAHAAAAELVQRTGVVAVGGFGLWRSAESQASRSINPTGLADGKSDACNEGAFAGKMMAGGRGT